MDNFSKNFPFGVVLLPPVPPTVGTSLTLSSGHGVRFPPPPFTAAIWPHGVPADPTNAELVRVTAVSGDVWTITRGAEGSTVRAIASDDYVAQALTAKAIADLVAESRAYSDAKLVEAKSYTDARVLPRVQTLDNPSSAQANLDTTDIVVIRNLSQGLTLTVPSGTLRDMAPLLLRIRDNGVAQPLTWANAGGHVWGSGTSAPLPSATVANKTMHFAFRYDTGPNTWYLVAIATAP